MASGRRGHATKSTAERREYRDNFIRPKDAPTVDPLPPPDATVPSAALGVETTRPNAPETRPATAKRRARGWIEGKGFEIVVGAIIAVVIGFVTWIGSEVYALNREIGELRQRLEAIDKSAADGAASGKATEERIQRQIDRLQDRLDAKGNAPTDQGKKKP